MKMLLIILGCCLALTGCASTQKEYSQMPITPQLRTITKPPFVSRDADTKTYRVTDEFVQRSLQLEDYFKGVQVWKRQNSVP